MPGSRITSTFFGTSSLYLTDGTTGVFVDAFLTRPSLVRVVLGKVRPDRALITETLDRAGVGPVDAVLVAHSHHDHAMDAADVVQLRGGVLHGSGSTLNIGRGAGLEEARLHRIADGDELHLGAFTVRVLEGLHSPGNRYPGTIDAPLTTPARASAYKDGGCYSFLVTHPAGSVLVHPSANFVPGKLDGVHADVLYLGVGALGAQDARFQQDYWRHVVEAVGPATIIPIHWDNFGHPLSRKLRPLPRVLDRFDRTRAFLDQAMTTSTATLRWQDALETLTLFPAPPA